MNYKKKPINSRWIKASYAIKAVMTAAALRTKVSKSGVFSES